MQLTDLHASNIFFDQDWNIKYVIDLEWACSLPTENLQVPWWLTGKAVDEIQTDLESFESCYKKFIDAFEQEESSMALHYNDSLSSHALTMRRALENGQYWYLLAL